MRAEGGTEDRTLLMKELSLAAALGQDTVFPRCAVLASLDTGNAVRLARLDRTGSAALCAHIRYASLSTLTG